MLKPVFRECILRRVADRADTPQRKHQNHNSMKYEQPMTGRESLELISAMIVDTRRRYHFEDGRLHLFWGYLDIAVALLVWGVGYFTQSAMSNVLWALIPLLGLPLSRLISRKNTTEGYALSYTDRMISSMWRYVTFLSFAFALICLLFSLGGHPGVWMLMFFYSFLVVGMGTAFVGLLLDYRSMLYGGGFSILAGAFVITAAIADSSLLSVWAMPLFIASNAAMFVIPGHLIQAETKRRAQNNTPTDV